MTRHKTRVCAQIEEQQVDIRFEMYKEGLNNPVYHPPKLRTEVRTASSVRHWSRAKLRLA